MQSSSNDLNHDIKHNQVNGTNQDVPNHATANTELPQAFARQPPRAGPGLKSQGQISDFAGSSSDSLASHLYINGIQRSLYSDTTLRVNAFPAFKGHALLLAQSAILNYELSKSNGPPYDIAIEADSSYVTKEGIDFVIGYLYAPQIPWPASSDSLQLLASAAVLGVHQLAVTAANQALHSISPDSIVHLLHFTMSSVTPSDEINGAYPGPFPPYTQNFMSASISFLTSTFLDHHSSTYSPLLMTLPFPLLKQIVESSQLPLRSSQQRYNLARDVLGRRQQWRQKTNTIGPEETVVLAFGGSESGIELIQRIRGGKRTKSLWKASS